MKIFTCSKFTGHWPVGTAAAVAARDATCAAALLNEKLKEEGLPGDATAAMMEEFAIPTYENQTEVRILCNGDY